MRVLLTVLVPALALVAAGLAFTVAVCLATGAIAGVAYVVLGSAFAEGPPPRRALRE